MIASQWGNRMTLRELLDKVGDEDQMVALLVDGTWCCVFPVAFCPSEYEDYVVDVFLPDHFVGESPFDGIVIKVCVKEPT